MDTLDTFHDVMNTFQGLDVREEFLINISAPLNPLLWSHGKLVVVNDHPSNLVSPFTHQLGLKLPVVDMAELGEDALGALGVEILRVEEQPVHVKQYALNTGRHSLLKLGHSPILMDSDSDIFHILPNTGTPHHSIKTHINRKVTQSVLLTVSSAILETNVTLYHKI